MVKGKKSFLKNRSLLWGVVFVLVLGGFFFLTLRNYNQKITQTGENDKPENNIYYPQQYSDAHYSKSISETNSRYKNVVIVDKNALLANVISSVSNNTGDINSSLEEGTWLWTPTLTITPAYREFIIAGAKKNNIKNIYLSIDSYLDVFLMPNGKERDRAKQEFNSDIEDFIAEAHKNGISVDAEAGWQNWAEPGNLYKPLAVLDFVINFNKTHSEKFRGFQYDVESYLLPGYEQNKTITLYNFVYLIDQTVAKLNNTDLLFSVVVPDFYDKESAATPEYSYRGETSYTFDHLLTVLERRAGSKLIVMSYRNFSKGEDGSIDISNGEMKDASSYHTKVVIAQETGDIKPSYVTFYNTSRKYFDRQRNILALAFGVDSSFGGFATHYVNSFLELSAISSH